MSRSAERRSAAGAPVPPRTARRPDPRPARSLQRLHAAAIELGAEHGINGTTVDDIAERARVSKGTVYNNVASKEELFTGALVAGVDRLTEALALAAADGTGGDAVRAVVTTLLTRVTASADLARLFLAEAWRPGRPWHEQLQAARRRAVAVLERTLREWRPGLAEPGLAATAAFSAALVVGLDLVSDPQEVTPARLDAAVDQLLGLFSGLTPADRSRPT